MTRVRTRALLLGAGLIVLCAASNVDARQTGLERLPAAVLDVMPPSAHVRGAPGAMTVQPRACRTLPTGQTRRRMVDVAVQEWAFFGFHTVDQTDANYRTEFAGGGAFPDGRRDGQRPSRLPAAEAARVAASIAGYWAVTPEGSWIVAKQNEWWNGQYGTAVRWNAPWSAAFISWVMCEAGLGATNQFQRAIAHHAYIDQAIRARDGRAPEAAFTAYDAGETAITPGDLLCSSRRPAYRTIAQRRQQLGVGARSHCDIVVKVDEAGERIFAIGGNVRGAVALKLLRATREAGKPLRLIDMEEARPIFAHLKLRADPLEPNALDTSPTIKTLACVGPRLPAVVAAANPAAAGVITARC